MHIAVDQDDVTLDFIGGVLKSFELEFGEPGIEDFQGAAWGQEVVDFSNHPYFKTCGYDNWWGWLRDRDWLWGKVFEAIPGAVSGVKRLREQGHYVECITSKPPWAEPAVWQFQGRYRIPFNRITVVTPGERKLDFTDAEVIVDDKRQTCEEFVDAGRLAVHFDRNKVPALPEPNLHVAANWQEVLIVVEEVLNAKSSV